VPEGECHPSVPEHRIAPLSLVGRSVLIADDQPLLRMGFRMILEAQRNVTVAGSPIDESLAEGGVDVVMARWASPSHAEKDAHR
jgi:hypothetical protein